MNENIKQELYKIVDHFLTEAKNQNGEERSLDRLNADRHLAVENLEALFIKQQEENQKIIDGIFEIKEKELARQKEEPAYIGGVNLTTNDDNEISNRLAVTDKNIDQLRQWLNEDRIDDFKKMITNDDIKFWLDIK